MTSASEAGRGGWAELMSEGRAAYSTLALLSTLLHALQILVIAIIMPTIVAELGGAAYYSWAAVAFTVGAIVGAVTVGPVWAALGGGRPGTVASGFLFLAGTVGCALAPDMTVLIVSRAVQGLAGGLLTGGTMAMVSLLFEERLRRRILAMFQGVWMIAQLAGPVVGGAFAQFGWWRGSFWVIVPLVVVQVAVAWWRLPRDFAVEQEAAGATRLPLFRILMLASGVCCVGAAGPVDDGGLRALLLAAAFALLFATFRLDRAANNRLYPSGAVSFASPVGLAFWILFLTGMVQNAVTLFLPLLLQVVHGVAPIFISFVTVMISFGWTVGTFSVSGWSGVKERVALMSGPLLMLGGTIGIAATALSDLLWLLALCAFVLGVGIGTHNVHLVARTMAAAREGEHRLTASAMPSVRSLGTAFGAALAGMLVNIGGLGDATDPGAVGDAISFAYGFSIIPFVLATLLMARLLRLQPSSAGG